MTTSTMTRSGLLTGLVALLASVLGCSKSASPPGGFGVNITVDAKAISAADRMSVTIGALQVSGDESKVKTIDVHAAIQSGALRFRYIPAIQTGSLTFGFDALDASDKVIGTGSSGPVSLTSGAVSVTITLGAGSGKKRNGATCGAGGECGSGFCADGVCCNEKCDDVCVSCALKDSNGVCTPYAENSDPELECTAKLPPTTVTDAGAAGDATAGEGGATSDGVEAGASDGAASDAVTGDGATASGSDAAGDAPVIHTPDGGTMTMAAACGGTCGGKRACKFPDSKTSCGKPFCNDHRDVASFVCDGNGGCSVTLSACMDFGCGEPTGACRTQCASHAECLLNDYCNGDGKCVVKKGDGLTCITDDECRNGHCSSGVCCNTKCDAPNSCNTSGSIGQCKCPGVTCAAGVACQIYYLDADLDGFGDLRGTVAAATAMADCLNGTKHAGYVDDNTDCDDGDANVHPGQAGFFNTVSKSKGTFDYNCDGKVEKESPEYPGGSCKFCGAVGSCDATTSTCGTVSAQSAFACPQELFEFTRVATAAAPASAAAERAGLMLSSEAADPRAPGPGPLSVSGGAAAVPVPIRPPPICQVCILQCCGCHAVDQQGFTQAVACGAVATFTSCGACSVAGGFPANSAIPKQQRCR